jgi:hypothetical protein
VTYRGEKYIKHYFFHGVIVAACPVVIITHFLNTVFGFRKKNIQTFQNMNFPPNKAVGTVM